jgi:tetratricopeptide (TPR) repeat protein
MRYQGRYDEAYELYEEALPIFVQETQDDWGVGMTLHNMAHVAVHKGDYDGAAALLERGMTYRGARGNRQVVALYLALLGRLLLEQGGQPEILKESARLLAACTSLLEGMGISMEKADQLHYEYALETVRNGLSEEDFRSASRLGRSLTLAQAVDIAGSTIQLLRENARPSP